MITQYFEKQLNQSDVQDKVYYFELVEKIKEIEYGLRVSLKCNMEDTYTKLQNYEFIEYRSLAGIKAPVFKIKRL